MSAIIKEDGKERGIDHGQMHNGAFHEKSVVITGAQDGNGFVVIYDIRQQETYLPGDQRLPLTLDDGETVNAIRTATQNDFLDPML